MRSHLRFVSSMAFESVCIILAVRLLNNWVVLFSSRCIKELPYEELFSYGSYVQERIFPLVLYANLCRIFDWSYFDNR